MEARKYRLDLIGISSSKRRGFGTVDLGDEWKLFCIGVDPAMSAHAGVEFSQSPIGGLCRRMDPVRRKIVPSETEVGWQSLYLV